MLATDGQPKLGLPLDMDKNHIFSEDKVLTVQ